MAIVATAGTTDFGSVDPLHEIAGIARKAHVWLHVDAAYGGALLFSPQHREKLAGIEAADSIAIDFHKLLWQPIPCSAFLLHDVRHFDAIKLYADYLNPEFQEEKGIPNLVTTSLLTSRRFDALKLWISFQSLGREKLAAMIDRTIGLADYAAKLIRAADDLELICQPQLSTVVFRYIVGKEESNRDRINAELRENLFHRGAAVVGHTRIRGRQCLKLTCMNPATSEADLEGLIALIRREGEKSAARIDK
jgi:L-2,4-diaminobutyrate decarboxylase